MVFRVILGRGLVRRNNGLIKIKCPGYGYAATDRAKTSPDVLLVSGNRTPDRRNSVMQHSPGRMLRSSTTFLILMRYTVRRVKNRGNSSNVREILERENR